VPEPAKFLPTIISIQKPLIPEFVLSERDPGIVSLIEMHMHGLAISIDGKDSIKHNWRLFDKGEKKSVRCSD
jgi:hypothetical protein